MSLESSYKSFELPGYEYYKAAGIEMPRSVEIRNMTVKEVKYFSILGETSDLELFIDSILSSCCKTPVDWDALLEGDRIYLFYMLRAITFDNIYTFRIKCQNCKRTMEAGADLFALPKKDYDPANGYPIKVPLPKSNKLATLVLPTRGITKKVDRIITKLLKDNPNMEIPREEYILREVVKGVSDLTDDNNLFKFLADLHFLDWRAMDKMLQKVAPGLDLDVIVPCEDELDSHGKKIAAGCGFENLTTFSFRPKEFFLIGDP